MSTIQWALQGLSEGFNQFKGIFRQSGKKWICYLKIIHLEEDIPPLAVQTTRRYILF